jgi:Sulfotransferase family
MVPFAVDVAVAFRRGSARGERSQFSSMGICRDRLMSDLGACINQSIIGHRSAFEERARQRAGPGSAETHAAFKIARDESDPKTRWVNGTPEYSLGISGLRKLFPGARFIHLLRNCEDVVPSIVHLECLAGTKLVANEQEAYELWIQFVQACVESEKAYGPEVVCRLLYEDLVREPEKSIRRILDFIGEPFAPVCLEPLVKRINSSRVASGVIGNDAPADPAVVREARDLWNALREAPSLVVPSPEAAARLEEQFERRVDYVYKLDTHYERAQEVHKKLAEEFAERTEWALHLEQEVAQKNAQVLRLREEFAERTEWALRLDQEVAQKSAQILRLQEEFDERTEWALHLDQEVAEKTAQILQFQEELSDRAKWAANLAEEVERKDALILALQKKCEGRIP